SPAMPIEQLKRLRRRGSLTPGHPEFGHTAGIECTTGPLGQGLATAVGMAIAERALVAEMGDALAGHRIVVMAGDGCLMEGVSHEAGALAGHLQLANLTVLFDDNAITIDGAVGLASSEDVLARFAAYGWTVVGIDGHDLDAIDAALCATRTATRPTLIACSTRIGKGAPTKAGSAGIHGSPLGTAELRAMREAMGWPHAPFVLPADLVGEWRACGARGQAARARWSTMLAGLPADKKGRIAAIERGEACRASEDVTRAIRDAALAQTSPKATRVSSKDVLEQLVAACPWLRGGSADLSGSNGTRTALHHDFGAADPGGNYVRYGVREHGMAAAMNGIALTGAHVPYGGTFLAFSDYCRPAIRLAALMRLRVVYVFTHDSIGLGEDGPTHQPVEHLASLRAIPGLLVLRPADAVEVAECWEIALGHQGPSVLALSRQDVPLLRDDAAVNRSASGAYVLADCAEPPDVSLIASGSEVTIALEARSLLASEGRQVRVISAPCLELIDPAALDGHLGPPEALRVSVEAGATLPWRALLGRDSLTFGVDRFGESASAGELYEDFSLTPAAIAATIRDHRSSAR
ncbi:MAG TPA: transketolase, partial [Sphingomonas sp.]